MENGFLGVLMLYFRRLVNLEVNGGFYHCIWLAPQLVVGIPSAQGIDGPDWQSDLLYNATCITPHITHNVLLPMSGAAVDGFDNITVLLRKLFSAVSFQIMFVAMCDFKVRRNCFTMVEALQRVEI